VSTAQKIKDQRFHNIKNLISRILLQHFVSILATSALTVSLFVELARHPDKRRRLSEEALSVFANPKDPSSWTLEEISSLDYFDSFVMEALRLHSSQLLGMRRVCTKKGGYEFSDGTIVPEKWEVAVALYSIHRDERYYEKPHEFMPERWLPVIKEKKARENDARARGEHILGEIPISSTESLGFGHGKHVW
jgi:cytochrome P450